MSERKRSDTWRICIIGLFGVIPTAALATLQLCTALVSWVGWWPFAITFFGGVFIGDIIDRIRHEKGE